MGGYGSGRWSTRATVEDCGNIDINWLKRRKYIKNGCHMTGSLYWSIRGENIGGIGYEARLDLKPPYFRLQYTVNDTEKIDCRVPLTRTPVHFGGHRWWFICPGCGRRVGKLHLYGKYFLCRICQDLTYTSCNESHKYDSVIASIAVETGMSFRQVKKALFDRKTGTSKNSNKC